MIDQQGQSFAPFLFCEVKMPYDNLPEGQWDAMDRCVEHVQGQGHDKESAIAICMDTITKGAAFPDGIPPLKLESGLFLGGKVESSGQNTSEQNGVMIALMIPPAIADQIKVSIDGALPPEEMHVTLAFLGDVQDLPADGQAKALDVMKAVAAQFQSISGKINGSGRFVNTDTGQDAIYLNFDSPELPTLRASIIEHLKQAGLPAMENHGFSPHITLAYVDPAVEMPALELPKEPITIEKLTLAWGGKMEDIKFGPPITSGSGGGNPEETQSVSKSALKSQSVSKSAVKAAGDWELDVLGVPFNGPDHGRDSDGQYFSPKTNIHQDVYPTIPAVYYHGLDPDRRPMGDPEILGKAQYSHVNQAGHWWHVVLDKASPLARRIWEAAKAGTARASSGSVGYLARLVVNGVKRMYDKTLPGEIINWPVVELTLIDAEGKRQPANSYAVAIPAVKTMYERAGLALPDLPQTEQPGQGEESRSVAKTESSNQGAKNMEPTEVQKMIADALKTDRETREAEAKAAAEKQAVIEAAVKAEREKWEKEAAAKRRLPLGAPVVAQFGHLRRYDNLSPADAAFAAAMLRETRTGPSKELLQAVATKVADGKDAPSLAGQTALKALGIDPATLLDAAKANELDYSTQTGFGDELVPTVYGTEMWAQARMATFILAKIQNKEFTGPGDSFPIPVESTDPTFYRIGQATDLNGTTGRPDATVGDSKIATANASMTLGKVGTRVPYTGELVEDSIIDWVAQVREQTGKAFGEQLEHLIVDGDTATGATTNINHIGGTPTSTGTKQDMFLTFNGLRKSPLVTTTANSLNAAGTITDTLFLQILQLMGAAGMNALDIKNTGFVIDLNVAWKAATLAAVKTQDVFSQATIENGLLRGIYGYEVNPSGFMHYKSATRKANTAGKVDQTTPANNTTGAILAVRWDQWLFGWKRHMIMKLQDIPDSDAQQLICTARVGLVQRDTEASAIAYNVAI